MFGIELISVGLLHMATLDMKPSVEQISCAPTKPLFIDVVSAQGNIRYDFSKKTAELNRIGKGAYSPYGEGHRNTEFQGLTAGKQSLDHNIQFYFEEHKDKGLACLQIQKVKVTMNYNPIIYISTKFDKDTPIFHKILEHEKEHVRITQTALNKYENILEERLKNQLENRFSVGPFPIDNIALEQQRLRQKVKQITTKVFRTMNKEARRQHNLFDDVELNDKIEYNKSIARRLEEIFKLKN
jgi:hypothetical protein